MSASSIFSTQLYGVHKLYLKSATPEAVIAKQETSFLLHANRKPIGKDLNMKFELSLA